MIFKSFLFLPVLFLSALIVKAQDKSLFNKQVFIQGKDTMPYRILLPENYDPNKKYPLVFFLHGRGESGTDNEKQLVHGSKMFLNKENREAFPAIVVFPQCPNTDYWSNVKIETNEKGKRAFSFYANGKPTQAMATAMKLLRKIMAQYPVDTKRVYAGGLSMGGMGTYELVRRKPKLFAAAFAICGGANPETAKKMTRTKWWLFHGEKDDVVDPVFTKEMYAALKAAGADVKITLYPNANHNSWDPAFAEPGLLPWLFSVKK